MPWQHFMLITINRWDTEYFVFVVNEKKECLMLVWMAQNAIPFDRLLYRRHFSYVFKQCKRKSHLPLNDFYVPCSIIVCWNFDDRTHKMEAALCQTSHLATRSGPTFNDSGTHISNNYKIWYIQAIFHMLHMIIQR